MFAQDEKQRLHQSLAQFKQLLATEPHNVVLLEKVARVYARLGRPAEAADYLADRAEILFEGGDLQAAAVDCRRALAHAPGHQRARRLLEGLSARGVHPEDDTEITDPPAPFESPFEAPVEAPLEPRLLGPEGPPLEPVYELRVVPASIPPEGVEAMRRTPIVDAESLLATHDADELALGVDPPTLPPDFLEPDEELPEYQDEGPSLLSAHPTPATRSRDLERAITSKLPRIAPPSASPRVVSATEAGPVSADLELLQALPKAELRRLLAEARRERFSEDQKVVAQNSPAEALVLIQRGRARVERLSERGREQLGHVGEDDLVGLVEHLRGARWRITLLAETDLEVRLIPGARLARLRVAYPGLARALQQEAEHQELLLMLTTGPLFRSLTPGQREALARSFRPRVLLADEVIVREGARVEGLFLVRDGKLAQLKDGVRLPALNPGDAAGVLAALAGGLSPVTVMADEGAEVFFLEREALATQLDLPLVREAFERVAELRRLTIP